MKKGTKTSTLRAACAAAALVLGGAPAFSTEGAGLSVYPDGLENFIPRPMRTAR